MAYKMADKLVNLVPYDPIQGNFSVRLDANESFISLSVPMREKIGATVSTLGFNRYPDPYCEKLLQAAGEFFGVKPEAMAAGNGSDELIGILTNCFLQKGETVATLLPDFSMYRFYADLAELKQLNIVKPDSLLAEVDEVISLCQENNARMLIFSNPCNPTSLGLRREEVIKLIESLPGTLVVVDEAYMDFWDQSVLDLAGHYDNLIVLKTCSKAVGMAGIRLGFAISSPKLIYALRAAKSPYNVNSMTQAVGVAILEEKEYLAECVRRIVESRDQLQQALDSLAGEYPQILTKVFRSVTNFIFVQVQGAKTIFEKLLEQGVAVRFMGDYLRITAGSPKENELLLAALRQALS